MPKVLVTGAAGFVGSRLVRLMVSRGYSLKLFVRPTSSLRALSSLAVPEKDIVPGDVTSENDVYRALAGCDRLIHVASVFRMWARNRKEIMDTAVQGTLATLRAAQKRNLHRVVVTSSVAAVGVADCAAPMNEQTPFNLEDSETYIVAKRRAEEAALEFASIGLPVVVVNPTTVLGPGDWKPTPSGASILSFLRWKWPLRFPTSAGGLNIVDVDDVAAGHIGALEKGTPGQRYILGGENLAIRRLFEMLAEVTGLKGPGGESSRTVAMQMGRLMELGAAISGVEPPLTYRMARDFVDRYVWVSSEKAEQELGYQHRPARTTILRAVQWYVQNGYLDERCQRRLRLEPGATHVE